MNQHLQTILNFIQQSPNISDEEKAALSKAAKDTAKELEITSFKLDRTEKVKRTTAILLEETIEELEQKRKAVEAQNRELEIESSLERVRTVAMSMSQPDDLLNICEIMFQELKNIGFAELRNAMIDIHYDEKAYLLNYDYSDDAGKTITKFFYGSHPIVDNLIYHAKQSKEVFTEMTYSGKALEEWRAFRQANGEEDDIRFDAADALYYYFYSIGSGAIGISTFVKASDEQLAILKRFRNVFDLAYKRYVDITNAEAQAREAQIEAALEKIRSRSLAMHRSDELKDVIAIMFEKLNELDVLLGTVGIWLFDKKTMHSDFWIGNNLLEPTKVDLPFNEELMKEDTVYGDSWRAWLSGNTYINKEYSLEQKNKYFDYVFANNSLTTVPAPVRTYMLQVQKYVAYLVVEKNSSLFVDCWNGEFYSEASLNVLKRTAKVFEQAYVRFLDLQKAEAQSKESQIQLALERVRARTMAMQKSDELADVSELLFKQVSELGIQTWATGFNIWNDDNNSYEDWITSPRGGFIDPYIVDATEFPPFVELSNARKSGEEFYVQYLDGKTLTQTYQELLKFGNKQQFEKIPEDKFQFPAKQYLHLVFGSKVSLMFITYEPVPEAHDIFKRFGKTFEQTYTRFLDLQKAEAQAREAQIQLALERVRARTMAMQHSGELADTASVLFQQIKDLGFKTWSCGFCTWQKNDLVEVWMGADSGGLLPPMLIPYKEEPTHRKVYEDSVSGAESHHKIWEGAALKEHYAFLKTIPSVKEAIDILDQSGLSLPERQCYYVGFFEQGYLLLITKQPNDELKELSKRFAKVFEQTYTRFLDLQKAEVQSRESQIQLALERVRSRSLAMHQSDELKDVVTILFQQLKILDAGFDGAVAIHLFNEHSKDAVMFVTAPELALPIQVNHPYDEEAFVNNPIISDVWNAKETGKNVLNKRYSFEEKNKYFDYVFKHNNFEIIPQSTRDFILGADSYTASFIAEKNSLLGANSWSHQIFSEIDFNVLIRIAKVFEQAYIRFLDLQKAEVQSRESQIQLALERVRARTMAMQKSDELTEAANLLFKQVQLLNLPVISCGYNIWEKEDKVCNAYMGNEAGFIQPPFQIPLTESPVFIHFYQSRQNKETFYAEEVSGAALVAHYRYMQAIPSFAETADKFLRAGFSFPEFQVNNVVNFSFGNLIFITYQPVPKAHDIFKRFGKTFEQTYTRFLDLQKAEAQAREAQIEAALERVRSASLSMQKTNQIGNVIFTLYTSLRNLDFALDRSMIIVNHGKNLVHWIAGPEGLLSENGFNVPYINHSYNNALLTHFEKRTDKWNYLLTGEDKHTLNDHLFNHSDFKLLPDFVQDSMKNFGDVHFTLSSDSYGTLLVSSKDPLSSVQADIISRFSRVFNQAYVRFIDLQKAEAQAREARIEAALERVRTKTLAMKSSQDIADAVASIFDELLTLGVGISVRCGISIFYDHDDLEIWTATTDAQGKPSLVIGKLNPNIHFLLKDTFSAWRNKDTEFTRELSSKELRSFYDALNEAPDYPFHFDTEHLPEKRVNNTFFFPEGALYTYTDEKLPEEARQLFKRFAGAFSLTYRRFFDLQKAEAQTREAQIETALERVRSRTLAMQKSDELAETSAVLFRQLINLGISPNRLYISILKDEAGDTEFWIADEESSKVSMAYTGNLIKNPSFKKIFDGWQQQKKSLVLDMQGDELEDHLANLKNLHVSFKGAHAPKRRLQYIAYFNKGFIGMASPVEQPAETLPLLERFAYVLNLTFTRFSDLQIAEAHALQAEQDLAEIKAARKKAEDALRELQITQRQLVQSEKMASLGELTAGIAHEIQNPLNFVNNFSEVSKELLDEMKAALESGNSEDAGEIANDIIQNLEKINHHGKRADAIVKGMLQHSRSSNGSQKQPTDINALCDEYIRLCYHGIRAKDNSLQVTIKTDFDTTIEKISLIPQDIGRVILNILTNAFYALNAKKKLSVIAYEPSVSIQTKKVSNKIEIRIADNGIGIPQNIVDKIFQPFFTTKPAGSGTGLGLSLAYDIITKEHSGTIEVESKQNEGSTFKITLPL